jgi:magnesium transporter
MSGEEVRSLPFFERANKRLSWLSINVILNIIAVSIIAFHQNILEQVVTLAIFLPIISDLSGCSGNQAVAVSIRELSLGLIQKGEFLHVLRKEATVGLFNGLILGLIVGGITWYWKNDLLLGAVVTGALFVNTVVAVALGGTIPLLLKNIKIDPALASGPMLTTVTDMCGFFVALKLAEIIILGA